MHIEISVTLPVERFLLPWWCSLGESKNRPSCSEVLYFRRDTDHMGSRNHYCRMPGRWWEERTYICLLWLERYRMWSMNWIYVLDLGVLSRRMHSSRILVWSARDLYNDLKYWMREQGSGLFRIQQLWNPDWSSMIQWKWLRRRLTSGDLLINRIALPTIFRACLFRERGRHLHVKSKKKLSWPLRLSFGYWNLWTSYEPWMVSEPNGKALCHGASALCDDHDRGWPSPESCVLRSLLVRSKIHLL